MSTQTKSVVITCRDTRHDASDGLRMVITAMVLATAYLVCLPLSAHAGINATPSAVFLSDSNRTARVTVKNESTITREVSISMRHGYPVSDAAGNITFQFIDAKVDSEHFAGEWIKAYPSKFVLQPGEAQVIVLHANPPPGLSHGEYWARPVIISRVEKGSAVGSSTTLSDQGAEAMPLGLVLSLHYRIGRVATGISVTNVTARAGDGKIEVMANLERTNNAAFLGSMVGRVVTPSGETVRELRREIAVYHTLRPRMDFDIATLKQGRYIIQIEINTKRENSSPNNILHARPIIKTLEFAVL